MTEELQTILAELKSRLSALYGERLERLILFGSRARGDAEPDSDIDVLVVLKGALDTGRELWVISEITAELSLRHDTVLSTVVVSGAQYSARSSHFWRTVQSEGRVI